MTEVVAIGASAGAVEALSKILPKLKADLAVPIVVVVHLPRNRDSLLVDILQAKCRIRVKEAEDKEPLTPGAVYFAPPDYHVLVESDRRLSLSSEEPVHFSRPSIDVLFESCAESFPEETVAIVLTGANSDGADGAAKVCAAGGKVIVQQPMGAYASEMPNAALAACPSASVLNLDEITDYLNRIPVKEAP